MREQKVLDYELVKAETSEGLTHKIHKMVQSSDHWEPKGSAIVTVEVFNDKSTSITFYQTMFRYNQI